MTAFDNGYAERLVGSIRRECLDHVIVFGERHLRTLLLNYQNYYNECRTHLSLDKDAPLSRAVQRLPLQTEGQTWRAIDMDHPRSIRRDRSASRHGSRISPEKRRKLNHPAAIWTHWRGAQPADCGRAARLHVISNGGARPARRQGIPLAAGANPESRLGHAREPKQRSPDPCPCRAPSRHPGPKTISSPFSKTPRHRRPFRLRWSWRSHR